MLEMVDRGFRANALVPEAPPTRFYVNLTERCQLRCAHCITDAPALTASGRARSMELGVLERLTPHLAHAAYVGLVHAGEPMLAPLFEPFLEALRHERRGAFTVVHLLSNGVALTPKRLAELVALGVRSLSISLDGMSAETNDVLRVGSEAAKLTARIRELSALRARERWDLRMGVSWTITRSNLDELPGLVRFCAGAGLDWLKLEETYPVNEVARRESSIDPFALGRGIAGASRLGRELGLPVLDHTPEREIYKCLLGGDPGAAAFSALDDRVNRMEINGCRLPWELVCVEPDGGVKPMSFHHPAAGNLLEHDLLEIWRGEAFQRVRAEHVRLRPCRSGTPYCPPDPGAEAW